MLTRTAIIGAVLLGMAVPSTAQKSKRGEERTPARAERVAPRATPTQRYVAPRSADSRRGRVSAPVTRGRGGRSEHRTARVIPSPARRVHGRSVPVAVPVAGRRHHYETRRVWVPGKVRQVYVPACYEMRWDPCLRRYQRVCVHEAYYRTVQDPGCWEYQQVEVPGPHLHIEGRGVYFHF